MPSALPTPSVSPAGSPAPQGRASPASSFASTGTRQHRWWPAAGRPSAAAAGGAAEGPEGLAGLWPPKPQGSLGTAGWRNLRAERGLCDQGEGRGQGRKDLPGAGCVTLGGLPASLCQSPDLRNGGHHYTCLIRLSRSLNERMCRKSLGRGLARRKAALFYN